MDIRKIKKLIELLESSDVAEIEITEGEESVRINRYGQPPVAQQPMPQSYQMQQMPMPMQEQQAASQQTVSEVEISDEAAIPEGNIIRSPMVGTYYAAASPEQDDFVKVGSQIKTGDPVCVIEAMKMFNRIESDFDGEIVKILVENGQPVEYDEPLFVVK